MRGLLIRTATALVVCLTAGCSADGAASPASPDPDPTATAPPVTPPAGAGGAGAGGAGPGAGGDAPEGSGGIQIAPPPGGRPYDPDGGVTFTWPEAVPGAGETCKAGRYVGTFQCAYAPPGAGGSGTGGAGAGGAAPSPNAPFVVTGPVELTLLESQDGEFLEVSGGTLNGAALLAIAFTASLSGKLDCQTGAFVGDVTDGSYGLPPPPPPLLPGPPFGYFEGPTSATYSPVGPALQNGTWDFAVKNATGMEQGSCAGTWSATFVP